MVDPGQLSPISPSGPVQEQIAIQKPAITRVLEGRSARVRYIRKECRDRGSQRADVSKDAGQADRANSLVQRKGAVARMDDIQ